MKLLKKNSTTSFVRTKILQPSGFATVSIAVEIEPPQMSVSTFISAVTQTRSSVAGFHHLQREPWTINNCTLSICLLSLFSRRSISELASYCTSGAVWYELSIVFDSTSRLRQWVLVQASLSGPYRVDLSINKPSSATVPTPRVATAVPSQDTKS